MKQGRSLRTMRLRVGQSGMPEWPPVDMLTGLEEEEEGGRRKGWRREGGCRGH